MAIGARTRRFEDARFLAGAGRYVDDLREPQALHAVFMRSQHAHAVIRSIDPNPALAVDGVVAVLTGEDWRRAGGGALPCIWAVTSSDGTPMRGATRPVFAVDRVRHVGDTVAVVVAESAALTLDGAEALAIDYGLEPAAGGGVPPSHPGRRTCTAMHRAIWRSTGRSATVPRSKPHGRTPTVSSPLPCRSRVSPIFRSSRARCWAATIRSTTATPCGRRPRCRT